MSNEEILLNIFNRMLEAYGPRGWWPAQTRFEVILGTILTQNVSWKNVEIAVRRLKASGLLNPKAIIASDADELAKIIKSSRYYNQKAECLKGFCRHLDKKYGGSLDRLFQKDTELLRKELIGLKGIGEETADCILLYAGNKPSFVSDAYTSRFLRRFGLLDGNRSYRQIRSFFMANLPKDVYLYNEYHALIDHHCNRICKAEPLCEKCSIKKIDEICCLYKS